MSKEVILNNIKNAIKQNKLNSAQKPYKDLIKHNSTNLIEEYIALQTANKAIVVESNNVLDDIKNALKSLESKKILYTLDVSKNVNIASLNDEFNIIAYDKSVDIFRDELFDIDTSIICAKCGIADIGIFGLSSSPNHPRLASLVTTKCIVLLKKKNIVPNIVEGLNLMHDKNKQIPSNMIFIAGASRTADIELQTVFGVHGPQQVYIILI